MSLELSIIIPVHNQLIFTKQIVDDLMKLPFNNEIYVIDNASEDGTAEYLAETASMARNCTNKFPKFTYKTFNKNTGFSCANNWGYYSTSGKNVLFLNNDVKVIKDHSFWPRKMNSLADRGYLVGVQAGLLDPGFNFTKEGPDVNLKDPYSYLSGWCLCASRQTFDKLIMNQCRDSEGELIEGKDIGPWNSAFYPEVYFEDSDLSWRARDLGIPMKMVKLPLHHFGRTTGKNMNMSEMYTVSKARFMKERANV